ncbi:uncharacterized protein CIMG_06570 [Coccidioides immitis RS]|uniref:Conserved oligomeric Golgi complex subunit 2 n=4 Tax=Coccidioides immitis TaxID=5501 RepID=J3K8F2_COCIM|nr:uncharacterized protein CIMG_06570 [Coccidioides immitis RS]KMP03697.1 hypothetical protein CIRG_03389 [Coccidioides immitis RMSCC 2394]KMU74669.1 hypothetical protein CISG_00599 [Coccidioides immitis RMSCC 3703]KMU83192.1 hypothetical protein CIHG_00974 [Coccidioides immitis H538.4]TPX23943.1 hypothetical protein DIZ76_013286 [Coccidioides immitis]EAS31091.3 hypothetical protein CIMG_06570 [Coccidioides immitis RS]
MSRFYFGDSSESEAEVNDGDDYLPFPKPLSRSSFITPNFDPAKFLSSLSNRHQSLADLQTELRELSQSLSKELLNLVNDNYQDFLSLGTALKGGEERVEEIRAVLLGFQRDVQSVKEKFENRTATIKGLLDDKKRLRSDIAIGYYLLDIAEKIELLEQKLMVHQGDEGSNKRSKDPELDEELIQSEDDESGDDEDRDQDESGDTTLVSLRRLERHIQQYLSLKTVINRVGEQHPFVVGQSNRIATIKTALLLDLRTAVKQGDTVGRKREDRLLKILHLHELLGEETEAVMALLKLRI